mgnify:FL=1
MFYEMGMGKSILAIAIVMDAMATRKYSPIMLLTKSLHENMRDAIRKYVSLRGKVDKDYELSKLSPAELDNWISDNFSFVSMNASNMITQVRNAAGGKGLSEFDSVTEAKYGEIVKLGNLNGKILVVDEAHNFFRAITNGSANAIALYDMVMAARDLRIYFLTGTPVANDPFELVPCFNMLAGKGILPDTYREFNKLFVDRETSRIKNREKFQNRLLGLVSYVDRWSTPGASIGKKEDFNRPEFPESLPVIVEYVNMDPEQYVQYQLARDKEMEEGGSGFGGSVASKFVEPPSMTKPKSGAASTYRVRSRQLSNYCPPRGFEMAELDDLPVDSLGSAKYRKILENIDKHKNQLGLMYSQFVGMGGLGTFSRYLIAQGWKQLRIDDTAHAENQNVDIPKITGAFDSSLIPTIPSADEFCIYDAMLTGVTFRYMTAEDISKIDSSNDSNTTTTTAGAITPEDITWPNAVLIVTETTDTGYIWVRFSNGRGQIIKTHGDFGKTFDKRIIMHEVTKAVSCARGGREGVIDTTGASPVNMPNRVRTFTIISGEVSTDARARLQEIYNSAINAHGEICDLMLISSTGTEGLDLKRVRHIHIEPFWNMARIFQVKSRGERNDSHKDLPADEKNVQSYIYLAIPPVTEISNGVYTPTTDTELYDEALKDQELIDSFMDPLKEISIECMFNNGANCRKCSPTGVPLFTNDIARDIKAPDPCREVVEKTISAEMINYNGVDYYYVDDPTNIYLYKIFAFDKNVNGYRPLSVSDNTYENIAAEIAKKTE